jgi:hypothetical protein
VGYVGTDVYFKSFEKGGHFAGWERPEDVAEGLFEIFGKGGGAAGVVAVKGDFKILAPRVGFTRGHNLSYSQ